MVSFLNKDHTKLFLFYPIIFVSYNPHLFGYLNKFSIIERSQPFVLFSKESTTITQKRSSKCLMVLCDFMASITKGRAIISNLKCKHCYIWISIHSWNETRLISWFQFLLAVKTKELHNILMIPYSISNNLSNVYLLPYFQNDFF